MVFERMEWIHLAQAGVSYCALVSTVPERAEKFLTRRQPLLYYQEILCYME
jgi:hypothetical protein